MTAEIPKEFKLPSKQVKDRTMWERYADEYVEMVKKAAWEFRFKDDSRDTKSI